MSSHSIWYEGLDNKEYVVVADEIVRLDKDWDRDITFIHLVGGEVLESKTSIKVLAARLDFLV